MSRQEEIINTIRVLRGELEILSSRLKPRGTGYLYTALDVIQSRVDELVEEVTAPYFDEDVYGNLEGQSQLRSIQDSAAGRSNDDVEHTKEYYDTERNKAPNNEVWGGLSNRSMKQKSGRAVQTTSEMMQEELEPLPINISK